MGKYCMLTDMARRQAPTQPHEKRARQEGRRQSEKGPESRPAAAAAPGVPAPFDGAQPPQPACSKHNMLGLRQLAMHPLVSLRLTLNHVVKLSLVCLGFCSV